jgi:hypothetical protein
MARLSVMYLFLKIKNLKNISVSNDGLFIIQEGTNVEQKWKYKS